MTPAAASSETEQASRRKLSADSLFVGFALLIVLTAGQRILGFGRQLLLCRMMEPEEAGRWNLAFSMIVLAAPLLVLGIPGTFGKYTEYFRQRGQLHGFLNRTLRVTGLLTLVGSTLVILLAKPVAWCLFRDTNQRSTVVILGLALMTVIAFNATVELLTSLRQIKAVSWLRFFFSLTFFAVSMGIIGYDDSVDGVIISYAVASLATAIIGAVLLRNALKSAEPDLERVAAKSIWVKLLPFAGWLWLADLLSNLFAACDRYMIVHFARVPADVAAGIVGQYHSSRLIPEQMFSLAILFCGMLLPYLSHDWERNDRPAVSAKLNLTFKVYAVSMTTLGAIFLWVAPWLFDSFLAGKYAAGFAVTPWSLVSFLWYGMYVVAQTYLFCGERGSSCSIALALGLATNIVLNFMLLPTMGLLGAVMATAIGNGLVLIIAGYLARRHGMQWNSGVVIAGLLPVVLLNGAEFALGTVILVLVTNYFSPVLFSADEVRLLSESLHHGTSRARQQVPFIFPGSTS